MKIKIPYLASTLLFFLMIGTSQAQTVEDFFESGFINYTNGQYRESVNDFTKAIALEPKQHHLYYHRGLSYDYLRDHGAAIKDFDKALEINPNDAQCYLARALSKAAIKDYKGAIEDYDIAIELSPKESLNYYNRGVVYIKLSKNELGCKDFDKAIELGSDKAKEMSLKFCK